MSTSAQAVIDGHPQDEIRPPTTETEVDPLHPAARVMAQAVSKAQSPKAAGGNEAIAHLLHPIEGAPSRLFVHQIEPGVNPRKTRSKASRQSLRGALLAAGGVLQSVLVRPHPTEMGMYELIAGYGRHEELSGAIADGQLPESTTIPVTVVSATDKEALLLATMENVHREGMTVFEEGEVYAQVVEDCEGDKAEAAKVLGLASVGVLDQRLMMRRIVEPIREAYSKEGNPCRIRLGHLELLSGLSEAAQLSFISRQPLDAPWLKVDELRKKIEEHALQLSKAVFDLKGCEGCPSNSNTQGALFQEALSQGKCSNPSCFNAKTRVVIDATAERLRETYPRVEIVTATSAVKPVVLMAEGKAGVGAAQFEACGSCKDRGAAVSGLAGSINDVVESACFNPPCMAAMIRKREKAEAKAVEEASGAVASTDAGKAQTSTGAKSSAAKPAKAAAKPAAAALTKKVTEFRDQLWRDALSTTVRGNGGLAVRVVCAAMLDSSSMFGFTKTGLRSIASELLIAAGNGNPANLHSSLVLTKEMQPKQVQELIACAAVEIVRQMGYRELAAVLLVWEVDLSRTFRLNARFLDVLTKSEIEVVVKGVGLLSKMDPKAWKSALAGSKADLVKFVAAQAGPDFNTVPAMLKPADK